MELQLKILQTVLPLVTNYGCIHGDVLSDALLLVYKLQDIKSPIVSNTASATFRQLLVCTFEKAVREDQNRILYSSSRTRQISSIQGRRKIQIIFY